MSSSPAMMCTHRKSVIGWDSACVTMVLPRQVEFARKDLVYLASESAIHLQIFDDEIGRLRTGQASYSQQDRENARHSLRIYTQLLGPFNKRVQPILSANIPGLIANFQLSTHAAGSATTSASFDTFGVARSLKSASNVI